MERSAERLMGEMPLWRRVGFALLVGLVLAPAVYRVFLVRGPQTEGPAGQIVIRYMAWGNPQQLEVERDGIRRFNELCAREGRNVRVELFMPPAGGYVQKLKLMLASGTAPDVMRVDHYDFPAMVCKGYFRDLTDLWQNDPTFDLGAFHESAMAENYYQGRLYGLNVLFGGVICFYNQDLFARAGLEDPYQLWKQGRWTWEKFEECATRLTERDAEGRPKTYGFIVPGGPSGPYPYFWALWVWRYGSEVLSPEFDRCLLDSPGAIAGFQKLHDLLHKHKCAPTPADSAASAFTLESGNVAMDFQYTGMAPRYRDNIRDFAWDIAPIPTDPKQPVYLVKGNQLVMNAACQGERAKAAWAWMTFLTSAENELFLYGDERRRAVPTRKAVLDRRAKLDGKDYLHASRPPFHTDVFPASLHPFKELPIDATWPAWTTVAQNYVASFILDPNAKAEEAMPVLTRAVNQELAKERARMRRYEGKGVGGGK